MPEAAYPFVEVVIDTSGLTPVSKRSPGVIAIVGTTPNGAAGGTAEVNRPFVVDTLEQANGLFARVNIDGTVDKTTLSRAIEIALLQDPRPSKIYGVRASGTEYAAALASLEAADDVTFVALAGVSDVGAAANGDPASGLMALKEHIENVSAAGFRRVGVAMVDPETTRSDTYVDDVTATYDPLENTDGRMVLVAARGADGDAGVAAMAAIAGHPPHASVVLKSVKGFTIPLEDQYGPSEIKGLSEAGINPIIDPALIVGEGLHFAEARTLGGADLTYVDLVRVLDDIELKLKAGLIGLVGDARITKAGMLRLKGAIRGILGPLQRNAVIDGYSIQIPLLDILSIPESARTDTDNAIVRDARTERQVEAIVSITYGPAVHRIRVRLAPTF